MEEFFECADGCKLFYQIDDFTDPWKSAPTVLMVHGFAEHSAVWRAWVPYFARHFRVIRVDLRGYGRSTPMPESFNWSLEIMVDDLLALMRHLHTGPFHLIGAKSGGTLAFRLAGDHPELVPTLAGTPSVRGGDSNTPGWLKQIREHGLLAWARDTMPARLGSDVSPEESAWWIHNLQGATPLSTVLGYLRMVPTMNIGDVGRITCPTLVLMTTGAGKPNIDSYKVWQTRIEKFELELVEGNGSHAMGAYPDRSAALTIAFIKRHCAV